MLENELLYNMKSYVTQVNEMYESFDYKVVPQKTYFSVFQIQCYKANEGLFVYHHDQEINVTNHRILTYIWYLNTVEEGGETEVCVNLKIKPEQGKLLIFPASWTYPHRGIMPISEDKYIITGWVYTDHPTK